MARDSELDGFVRRSKARHGDKPVDVSKVLKRFKKRLHPSDGVDATALAADALRSALDGSGTPVDPAVAEAHRLAYPHQGSLAEEVAEHAGSEQALDGLHAGVRGKLFETAYVDSLNAGLLPPGWHAEIASSPTQPGWDVAILDGDGHVQELRQLKATADPGLVREALEKHPDIPVVVPHGEAAHIAQDLPPGVHVHEAPVDLHHLDASVDHAFQHAEGAAPIDFVPEISLAIIGMAGAWAVFVRRREIAKIAPKMLERGGKACIAAGAGSIAAKAIGGWAGLPVAFATRLLLGRVAVQKGFARNFAEQRKELRRLRSAEEGGALA